MGFESDGRRVHRGISITMRTPGKDTELAVGFLFTEGLIADRDQVAGVRACGGGNAVRVDLSPGVAVDLARLERHFYTGSSCGVCGKASLAAVRVEPRIRPAVGLPIVEPEVIHRLPDALRQAQVVFDRTGGLHASALFDTTGRLLDLREDVGRHNALDKLIGAAFWPAAAAVAIHPPGQRRVSFELVQKAAVAGVPILAAVGAHRASRWTCAQHGLTVLGCPATGSTSAPGRPHRRHARGIHPPDDLFDDNGHRAATDLPWQERRSTTTRSYVQQPCQGALSCWRSANSVHKGWKSAPGLGCMGMSSAYGVPGEAESIATTPRDRTRLHVSGHG